MRTFCKHMLFAAFAVSISASAFAQDELETRFMDFNDMLIDGDLLSPDGISATERGGARFGSLMNLRKDFRQDLVDSADETVLE